MRVNRGAWLVEYGTPLAVRSDVMNSDFNFIQQTGNIIVGSTGNKTITFKAFDQTVTFTTNFTTTGTFGFMVGCLVERINNQTIVTFFPPTYVEKSAGTAPTNNMLSSTETTIGDSSFPRNIVRVCECTSQSQPGSGPIHCNESTGPVRGDDDGQQPPTLPPDSGVAPCGGLPGSGSLKTPGCINWLVASARQIYNTQLDDEEDTVMQNATVSISGALTTANQTIGFGGVSNAGNATNESTIIAWHVGDKILVPRTGPSSGWKCVTNVPSLVNQVPADFNQASSFSAAGAPQNLGDGLVGD